MPLLPWFERCLARLADRLIGPAARVAEKWWDREVGLVMQRGRPPSWVAPVMQARAGPAAPRRVLPRPGLRSGALRDLGPKAAAHPRAEIRVQLD